MHRKPALRYFQSIARGSLAEISRGPLKHVELVVTRSCRKSRRPFIVEPSLAPALCENARRSQSLLELPGPHCGECSLDAGPKMASKSI